MVKSMFTKILICSIFVFMISNLICISSSYALDEIFSSGKGFLKEGNSIKNTINTTELEKTSDFIYNALLGFAIMVAIIVAMILGVQFMAASADEKAKVKEAIMPFTVGCFVVFGAFTIWRVAVDIGNDAESAIEYHQEVDVEEVAVEEPGDEASVQIGEIKTASGWIVERDEPPPKEAPPSGYTGSLKSWYGPEYDEYWDMDEDGDIDMDDFDKACGDWDFRKGLIGKMPDSCFDSNGNGKLDEKDGDAWDTMLTTVKTHYAILNIEADDRVKEEVGTKIHGGGSDD